MEKAVTFTESATGVRNIKLTVAYDGTAYHGFQRQANACGIQAILEERLATLCGHPVKINGAGRTDSGVHAYGQVVNFFTGTGGIPTEKIPAAMQGLLPPDIVIREACEVPAEFHARYSAQSKVYVYHIYCQPVANPFYRNYSWHIRQSLDHLAMHQAAQIIVGTHNFSAFQAAGGPERNPVRTILEASCRPRGELLEFSFWGTGFLYHMVRNLVGTLVDVGTGKRSVNDVARILAGQDRRQAGITAPPQGLYLKEVYY